MKTIFPLMMLLFFGLISCKNSDKVPNPVPSTPPVENPQPTPSPTTNVPVHPQTDATEIAVDTLKNTNSN